MMNLNIKDIVTLDDDNEYLVVSKADYEGDTYFYISDVVNTGNLKLLKLNKENNHLAEFYDPELSEKLLPILYENAKGLIEELNGQLNGNN
jgi:hypothetical protein